MYNIHDSSKPPDFSLVLGGPLFQLLRRLELTTPALGLLKKRIIVITLFAWIPIFLLCLFDGQAWGGPGLPFFYDIELQVRFLVALPLLIAAELLVHKRIRNIVGQFIDRDIITESVRPKFNKIIYSAMSLRNSVPIELFLLLFVFVWGHWIWSSMSDTEKIASGLKNWYATTDAAGIHLTPAGYWYHFISRPLFQFIVCRWYFRLFLWARFLWQTSRIKLNLIPTHPDHAAGLGFLGLSISAFSSFILAHGVLLAGLIANSIFFAGARLTDSMWLIAGVAVYLLLIMIGPLLVFSPALMNAKRIGLRDYGMLASKYVSDFDQKWVHGGANDNEPLIGSADIQSLADIGNSFQVIREIKPFPFGKDAVIQLLFCTLIPVLPLVLTMVPLNELITKIFTALL